MPELQILAFPLALIVVSALTVAYYASMKRQLRAQLGRREQIPVSSFGERYYPAPRAKTQIATFVAEELHNLVGVDYTGITPTDRFVEDLHIDELDSLAAVEILQRVEERFGLIISAEKAINLNTVSDLVELICAETAERA